MDDVLTRILELIEAKHGTAKKLADFLGIHPNVITSWKSGRNKSYRGHLPEISEFFGVSCDYLKTGKEKEPAASNSENGGLTPEIIELAELIDALPPDKRAVIHQLLRTLADDGNKIE